MPYKSPKQRRIMHAAANNPQFAKRVGIKQSTARKFIAHERKGRKHGRKR